MTHTDGQRRSDSNHQGVHQSTGGGRNHWLFEMKTGPFGFAAAAAAQTHQQLKATSDGDEAKTASFPSSGNHRHSDHIPGLYSNALPQELSDRLD